MIKINKLKKEDIGTWVVYKNLFKEEIGRIKSWNNKYIFVVYHCRDQWEKFRDYTAIATKPTDLIILEEKRK